MASWGLGAALTGLGQGIPQGIQESKGLIQNYDAGQDQAANALLGNALRMVQQQSQQPPPQMPQMPQQPPMGGMPPQAQPPMGGGPPPMGQGSPPMRPPQMGGPVGSPSPQPSQGGPMGQPGNMPPQGMMPPQQQQVPPQGQPQQQGWGQQGGQQQAGPLDWRQIIQAITQANPGAPPGLVAQAVNKAIPLMNSQSQLEWKQIALQQRQEALDIANQRVLQQGQQGQERLNQGQQRINLQAEMYGQAPIGGGGKGQQFSQDFDRPGGMGGQQAPQQQGAAASIADQIVSGKAPPVTTGMYRLSGPVRANLAEKHPDFDLAKAQLEWKKAEKMAVGLAGPQQMRFQQLGTSVVNTMDMAMQQAKELQLSGITPLNKAKLDALINLRGNSEIGQKAAKYVQTISFLKGEVANLENGGYAPTESSWTQARNVINENYGVEEFLATIPNAQRLINYRLQAQQKIPEGMSQGNRYQVPQGTEPVTQPKGGNQNFDRAAAKKAGYTDQEIDQFLSGK